MNHLDLFSGIGGFALATQLAGLPIVNRYYSDIEEYANRVYQKNFPAAIGLGDITKIDGKKLREKHGQEPWLITGGFPCQDISTAGAMRGLNSDRSGLWFHYWRLIDELRPQAAVIENVSALCSNGLDRVLISLADIGYDAEWSTISAAEVGAPHLR
jgi:DNA (cytosine-5)-methyltransferase 1